MPAVCGTIERRILVNYRCDRAVLEGLLPAPFRPKLVHGWGMAGICLIRLSQIHPVFTPALIGFASENAAHRIAVQWDSDDTTHEDVFIPRRDTNGLLNRLAGGRIFPGIHHAARFRVREAGGRLDLQMRSDDGQVSVRVIAGVVDRMPGRSVFHSTAEASEFFRGGAVGWSACSSGGDYDGLELRCEEWRMEPMVVDRVESSFFSNHEVFPPGSAVFDSAFLMRDIRHTWHARGRLTSTASEL